MSHTVIVEILNKPYQVSCPPEQEQRLYEAARLLNERMLELKSKGNIIGLERIAIMSALNLSYDYLQIKEQDNLNEKQKTSIGTLTSSIDTELRKLAALKS